MVPWPDTPEVLDCGQLLDVWGRTTIYKPSAWTTLRAPPSAQFQHRWETHLGLDALMTKRCDEMPNRMAWRGCTLFLVGLVFTFARYMPPAQAQTTDIEFERIIRLIGELPKSGGQRIGDGMRELSRRASSLQLDIEHEQDRRFLNNLTKLLTDGSRLEQFYAAYTISYLNFNSPELIQALDVALLKADDTACLRGVACVRASSSAVDTICRALGKKDPEHVRPRCESFAPFFDRPTK